eukprot:TRINITY_DN1689_c0_g1_i5.p1 TRINITY_DN1689_c0_g1~~TRINITY_DN1689_c0_g1_i5.p1  ORF type:complete len:374 (+),score=101.17 TRINITY_DN1689_c0_g1_i5:1073-2194(+)
MLYLFQKRLRNVAQTENMDLVDTLCSKRTLMITGIPTNLITEEDEGQIQRLFKRAAGDEVLFVRLVADYRETYEILLEKNALIAKLEEAKIENMRIHARKKIRRGACCCKSYVDAESEYARQLEIAEKKETRRTSIGVVRKGLGVAFVAFKSPEKAFKAQRIVSFKFYNEVCYSKLRVDRWKISRAPPPSDIIWRNFGVEWHKKALTFLAFNTPLVILTSLMTIPIVLLNEVKAIACMINGNYERGEINPGLMRMFVENYCAPLLLCVNNSLIIPFSVHYTACHELHSLKSYLEKSKLAKLIVILIFNIIILPSFGITTIYALFKNYDWYLLSLLVGSTLFPPRLYWQLLCCFAISCSTRSLQSAFNSCPYHR